MLLLMVPWAGKAKLGAETPCPEWTPVEPCPGSAQLAAVQRPTLVGPVHRRDARTPRENVKSSTELLEKQMVLSNRVRFWGKTVSSSTCLLITPVTDAGPVTTITTVAYPKRRTVNPEIQRRKHPCHLGQFPAVAIREGFSEVLQIQRRESPKIAMD
eukprot:bmy_03961T0